MAEMFLKILNMSLTASIVIAAVMVMRLALRRAPKIFSYLLWFAVLFRLLCPTSFELSMGIVTPVSVSIPEESALVRTISAPEALPAETAVTEPILPGNYRPAETYGRENNYRDMPAVVDSFAETSPAVTETTADEYTPAVHESPAVTEIKPAETMSAEEYDVQITETAAKTGVTPLLCIAYAWLAGAVIMVLSGIIPYIRLSKCLKGARHEESNIYISRAINNAFIMGFIRPRIYLPESAESTDREFIILHERTHLKRGDHIAKLIMYAALCLHWFNPLVWLSFGLFERDMEMSCDETVTGTMSREEKADYSQALLSVSAKRAATFTACFGESGAKSRIKNVLSFKKPAFWVMLLFGAAVVMLAVLLMGNSSFLNQNIFDVMGREFSDSVRIYQNGTSVSYPTEELEALERVLRKTKIKPGIAAAAETERFARLEFDDWAIDIEQGDSTENGEYSYQLRYFNMSEYSKGFSRIFAYDISRSDCDKIFAELDKLSPPEETDTVKSGEITGDTVFDLMFDPAAGISYSRYTFFTYDGLFSQLYTESRILPGGKTGELMNALRDLSGTLSDDSIVRDYNRGYGSVALFNMDCTVFNGFYEDNESWVGDRIRIYRKDIDGEGHYFISAEITTEHSNIESPQTFLYEISEHAAERLISLGEAAAEEANNSVSGLDMIFRGDYKAVTVERDGVTYELDTEQGREFLNEFDSSHRRSGSSLSEFIDRSTLSMKMSISLYPDGSGANYNKTVLYLYSGLRVNDGQEMYYMTIATLDSVYDYYIDENEYINAVNYLSFYKNGCPEILSFFNYRGSLYGTDSVFIDENSLFDIEYADDDICILTAPSPNPSTDRNFPMMIYVYSFEKREIVFEADTSSFYNGSEWLDEDMYMWTNFLGKKVRCTNDDMSKVYCEGMLMAIWQTNYTAEEYLTDFADKPEGFTPIEHVYVAKLDGVDFERTNPLEFTYLPDAYFHIEDQGLMPADELGLPAVSTSAAEIREGEYAYLDFYNDIPALKSVEIVKRTADGEERFRLFGINRLSLMNTVINKYDYSSAVIDYNSKTTELMGAEAIGFFKELPHVGGERLVTVPISPRIDPDSLVSNSLTLYPADGGSPAVLKLNSAKLAEGGYIKYYTIAVNGIELEYILLDDQYDAALWCFDIYTSGFPREITLHKPSEDFMQRTEYPYFDIVYADSDYCIISGSGYIIGYSFDENRVFYTADIAETIMSESEKFPFELRQEFGVFAGYGGEPLYLQLYSKETGDMFCYSLDITDGSNKTVFVPNGINISAEYRHFLFQMTSDDGSIDGNTAYQFDNDSYVYLRLNEGTENNSLRELEIVMHTEKGDEVYTLFGKKLMSNGKSSALDSIVNAEYDEAGLKYNGDTRYLSQEDTNAFLETLRRYSYKESEELVSTGGLEYTDVRDIYLYPDGHSADYNSVMLSVCFALYANGQQCFFIDIASLNSIHNYIISKEQYSEIVECFDGHFGEPPKIIALYYPSVQWKNSVYFASKFPFIYYADNDICVFSEGSGKGIFMYSFKEERLLFETNTDERHGDNTSLVFQGVSRASGEPVPYFRLGLDTDAPIYRTNIEKMQLEYVPENEIPKIEKSKSVNIPETTLGAVRIDENGDEYVYPELSDNDPEMSWGLYSTVLVKHTAEGDKRYVTFEKFYMSETETGSNYLEYLSLFYSDGNFRLSAMLSSDLAHYLSGTYTREGDVLVCTADTGEVFRFEDNGNTVKYLAEGSSQEIFDMKDGLTFKQAG